MSVSGYDSKIYLEKSGTVNMERLDLSALTSNGTANNVMHVSEYVFNSFDHSISKLQLKDKNRNVCI